VQFFVDKVLSCVASHIPDCIGQGGGVGCLMAQCQSQFTACLGATCDQ
jgi:hypothetical protein